MRTLYNGTVRPKRHAIRDEVVKQDGAVPVQRRQNGWQPRQHGRFRVVTFRRDEIEPLAVGCGKSDGSARVNLTKDQIPIRE